MSTLPREFLRLLREDPDFRDEVRREVLSKELLELPERFTAFVARSEAFMERTEAFMERTEAFMQQTQQQFSEVNTRLDGLEGSVERLDGTVNRLDKTVDRLTGTVGRLDGREYERRVSRTLTGEVSRMLGLRRGRLVYSAAYGLHQSFQDQMEDELDAERMTQSQWQELLNTDAIIRAVEGGKTVFVVSEISVTVHEEDIVRAVERASIIQQATGLTTYPAVVGSRIPQQQLEQAEARSVTAVTMQQQGEQ